eukprot:3052978-Rhodomonas_salina.1
MPDFSTAPAKIAGGQGSGFRDLLEILHGFRENGGGIQLCDVSEVAEVLGAYARSAGRTCGRE